jgi:hydroxylamine reductase
MKVTKETIIGEVLRANPEAIKVLMKYNLGCVACMGATSESIEQGAAMHGIDPEPLVRELNELFGGEEA